MATLVCLFTLWCTSLFAAIHPFLVLRWPAIIAFLFATTMWRQKALNDDKKVVIIIESSAKGTTLGAIAKKIGQVDTVKRFQKDPSARKKRSDTEIFKTVTERDLRNIGR